MGFYDEIGVDPIINARGPATLLGNCVLAPDVIAAMSQAAGAFVVMAELEERAGAVISQITGAEAGYVTNGAAGALTLAAAACIAGTDVQIINRLPDTKGLPHDILIHRAHRYDYDHALRAAGARLVEIGFPSSTFPGELEKAISEQSVGVAFNATGTGNVIPLGTVARIAHDHGLPVIVDAALAVPPDDNLRTFIDQGADLVAFSGGKWIGGPPASGFLAGRADLIQSVALQHQDMDVQIPTWPLRHLIEGGRLSSPPYQGLGRALKVGKEEIAGLITALNRYVRRDAEAELRQWRQSADMIADSLCSVAGVSVSVSDCDSFYPTRVPILNIAVDPVVTGMSAFDVANALMRVRPRIYVDESRAAHNVLSVVPTSLQQGEDEVVAKALTESLQRQEPG